MAVSTIPTLKANLYAALQALTTDNTNALYQVLVAYGIPVIGNSREWVSVGDVDGDQVWAAIGHQRREESYELTLIVFTSREGNDQQATTERAFALAHAIETELRGDPSVGGAVRVAGFGGHIRVEERSSGDGKRRGALLTITVTCHARI